MKSHHQRSKKTHSHAKELFRVFKDLFMSNKQTLEHFGFKSNFILT